jgi:hypothetical protein
VQNKPVTSGGVFTVINIEDAAPVLLCPMPALKMISEFVTLSHDIAVKESSTKGMYENTLPDAAALPPSCTGEFQH